MADLGKAYVQIVPSAQGISNSIQKELSGVGGVGASAGASLGSNLIGGIKKVVGVAAVGKVLKDAFSAGGDLQQSFGGLETIYEGASGSAKIFAMRAAEAGISANDYAEQAVSFGASLKQAFGGDTVAAVNAANTAIMDMADNSAKMGTDIGSVQAAYQGFAKQNYTMLDNLKLGYGGTKTEMERLLADAEKLTGVHYDINNLGDVYSAIHAIQGELGLTGVAAAEAQTTLTGSFGALKASWENLLAALMTGQGLETAIANLTTSFQNFGTNVITMLQSLVPQMPTMILGLVNGIISQLPAFLSAGVQLIAQLAVGLAQALPDIVAQIPELFMQVVEAITSVDWAGVGKAIIDGIIAGLKSFGSNLWEAAKQLGRDALQAIKDELHVGSPSRVFADEVGRWIPAGVAVGITEGEPALNKTVQGMIDIAGYDYTRTASAGPAIATNSQPGIDYNRLAQVLAARPDNRVAKLYMNGKEVARALFEDQRAVSNDHGMSLIHA